MLNSLWTFVLTNFVPNGDPLCDKIILHKCGFSVQRFGYVPRFFTTFSVDCKETSLDTTSRFSTVGSLDLWALRCQYINEMLNDFCGMFDQALSDGRERWIHGCIRFASLLNMEHSDYFSTDAFSCSHIFKLFPTNDLLSRSKLISPASALSLYTLLSLYPLMPFVCCHVRCNWF